MSRLRAPVVTPSDRRPVAALARTGAPSLPGRTWALASGSGAVGRSTLAAVIAARLVHRGASACVVDADWTGPNLSTLLGISHSGAASPWTSPALLRLRSAEHADLALVPGAPPLHGDPTRRDARRLLRALGSLPDEHVVVDLPAGTQDAALDLWLKADLPLLVAVPERLPLEATARLLARVFARRVEPWLARRVGAQDARRLLAESWDLAAGRGGAWMRALARCAAIPSGELAEAAARGPIHLVLNRLRRGDDVDVGHSLVTAAGHGFGLTLRFRAVIPWDDDGWIRARRVASGLPGAGEDLLGLEVDELLVRMATGLDVPPPGNWKWSLQEAAAAAAGGTR